MPFFLRGIQVIVLALTLRQNTATPTGTPAPNVTIYDFGLGVWPENLNIRPNGSILTTLINRPEVWQINPFKKQDGVLVHRFEGKASCLGIVETFPDVFHLLVGNFSTSPIFDGVTGTYGVWELDFTARYVPSGQLARVRHIVDVPQAEILDGMAVLNHTAGLVLVADCKAGVLYTVNVKKKTVIASISSPLFSSNTSLFVGIDGIKFRTETTGSYVYFTNAVQSLFGRVQIDTTSGHALGPVERLPVQLAPGPADDFIFDRFGNAYLTSAGSSQGIYQVSAPVTQDLAPTFITPITGPTACRFGRTSKDSDVLYITSTGGDFAYPNRTFTVTSKLSKIVPRLR